MLTEGLRRQQKGGENLCIGDEKNKKTHGDGDYGDGDDKVGDDNSYDDGDKNIIIWCMNTDSSVALRSVMLNVMISLLLIKLPLIAEMEANVTLCY